MPGMSGIELAAEIRDRDPHLPVLILTGHADAMQIPEDLPVLSKPFRSADLAARVATLLDDGRRADRLSRLRNPLGRRLIVPRMGLQGPRVRRGGGP